MKRIIATALASVVAAAMLAACSGIPTSGPVQVGPSLAAGADDSFVRVIARPPAPGMSQQEVVRGFLEASASSENNFDVARRYLTDAASARWDPSEGVEVYSNSGVQLAANGVDQVAVSGQREGTIGNTGAWLVSDPGSEVDRSFYLVVVSGEWRISQGLRGLLLSRSDVERSYRTFPLYFYDPSFATLVPDLVSVPFVGAGLATSLVDRLLSGPTPWLTKAVRTAVPDGTALAIGSVPVDAGVARIDLTPAALSANDSTRRAMSDQIIATLRQLPGITGIRLTVGDLPYVVADRAAVQPMVIPESIEPTGVGPAPTTLVSVDGEIRTIDKLALDSAPTTTASPESTAPVPSGPPSAAPSAPLGTASSAPVRTASSAPVRTASSAPAPTATNGTAGGTATPTKESPSGTKSPKPTPKVPDLIAPALSLAQDRYAALGPARESLWVGRWPAVRPAVSIFKGQDLGSPHFDRTGTLWSVARGTGVVTAAADDSDDGFGAVARVPVTGLPPGFSVTGIRDVVPSRDGTRAMLLVARGTRVETLLARVERRGTDISLADPRRIDSRAVDAIAAAWETADTVVLLGSDGAAPSAVIRLRLGFSPAGTGPVPAGAVAISAAPGQALLVGSQDEGGQVYRAVPGGWERLGRGRDPAYPG